MLNLKSVDLLGNTLTPNLMQRVDSLEKTLMLGGIGDRRRGRQEEEMAGWHH